MTQPLTFSAGPHLFTLHGPALKQAVALGLVTADGVPGRPFQASKPAPAKPAAPAPAAAQPAPPSTSDESTESVLARLAVAAYQPRQAGAAPATTAPPQAQGGELSFAALAATVYAADPKTTAAGLSLGRMSRLTK